MSQALIWVSGHRAAGDRADAGIPLAFEWKCHPLETQQKNKNPQTPSALTAHSQPWIKRDCCRFPGCLSDLRAPGASPFGAAMTPGCSARHFPVKANASKRASSRRSSVPIGQTPPLGEASSFGSAGRRLVLLLPWQQVISSSGPLGSVGSDPVLPSPENQAGAPLKPSVNHGVAPGHVRGGSRHRDVDMKPKNTHTRHRDASQLFGFAKQIKLQFAILTRLHNSN